MMKRLISLLVSMTLSLCLAACSKTCDSMQRSQENNMTYSNQEDVSVLENDFIYFCRLPEDKRYMASASG